LAAGNDQQDSNRKVSIEDGTAIFFFATCEVVMCGLAAIVSIRDVPALVRRGWRAADSRGCPSGAGLARRRGAVAARPETVHDDHRFLETLAKERNLSPDLAAHVPELY
jgi:hypothetical protein